MTSLMTSRFSGLAETISVLLRGSFLRWQRAGFEARCENIFKGRCDAAGVVVAQANHGQHHGRIVELMVELLHKIIQHLVVIDTGGDEQTVAAWVWDNDRFVA